MQNDVFNPVADTVNKQSELLLKEQNCFTVIDESMHSLSASVCHGILGAGSIRTNGAARR